MAKCFRHAGAFDPNAGESTKRIGRIVENLVLAEDRVLLTSVSSPYDSPIAFATANHLHPPVSVVRRNDGSFLLIDGEVYDFGEGLGSVDGDGEATLRASLRLLDRMLDRGPTALAKVDSAASYVLWDAGKQRLMLCRDRVGEVPVYWTIVQSCLVWGSNMDEILAVGIENTPHLQALDFFLASGFVPSPWTFVRGVHKVPPAHYVTWDGVGEPRLDHYWQPQGRPKLELSPEEQTERLLGLLETAIRHRIGADGRIGALLSGGIDSMLLVGLAAGKIGASIDSFTFNYTDYEGVLNEAITARKLTEHFGISHHKIDYRPKDFAATFEEMVRNYGEPPFHGVHSYQLSQVVDQKVPALMVGHGPDSWSLNRFNRFALVYGTLPGPVLTLFDAVSHLTRFWSPELAKSLTNLHWCARSNLPSSLMASIWSNALRKRLYRSGVYEHVGTHLMPEFTYWMLRSINGQSRHDRLTYTGRHYFSAEATLYWDYQWSRTYDLPIRHPYFDNSVCDFLMRLPRKEQGKLEFRRVAAEIMPRELAFAPKVAQALPLSSWFRGPLVQFVRDQLSPDRIRRGGVFDEHAVTTIVDDHLEGRNEHHRLLLALMSVITWLEQNNAPNPQTAGNEFKIPPARGHAESQGKRIAQA